MMELPLYMKDAFGHSAGLVMALASGTAFGFVLERAGFGRASVLAAQFYLTDLRVLKVMFSAIVTALISLFCNRPVTPDLAMTGEISLRGRVLPVGGVKEKVLAARRAGLTRVLLPAENAKDLADIPESRLRGLTVVPIENISELVRHAFELEITPS